MIQISTKQVYDNSASKWSRDKPLILSDYTARPFILELCKPISGCSILDLGCGEGYIARQLKKLGAFNIEAIDISDEMIALAKELERKEPLGINYYVGDCSNLLQLFLNQKFDIVLSVFMINYLSIDQMQKIIKQSFDLLKQGGNFIFAVPHPSLPFIKDKNLPFYFDNRQYDYFSGRNQTFEGEIMRRDGISNNVRSVHKNLEDYFEALKLAGFNSLPKLVELGVKTDHLESDPLFFFPLKGYPLHLVFKITK